MTTWSSSAVPRASTARDWPAADVAPRAGEAGSGGSAGSGRAGRGLRDPGQGGDALEGAEAVGGVVDHGGDHQLVGLGGVDEVGDAALDGVRRADDLGGQAVLDERAFQLVV